MYPEIFRVTREKKISLKEPRNPHPSPIAHTRDPSSATKSEVMNKFLNDCAQQLLYSGVTQKVDEESDHDASQEIQDILNATHNSFRDLTIVEVKSIFKETNPFLEDVLAELQKDDPIEEFKSLPNILKVESFPDVDAHEMWGCADSPDEVLSMATDYKEIVRYETLYESDTTSYDEYEGQEYYY